MEIRGYNPLSSTVGAHQPKGMSPYESLHTSSCEDTCEVHKKRLGQVVNCTDCC